MTVVTLDSIFDSVEIDSDFRILTGGGRVFRLGEASQERAPNVVAQGDQVGTHSLWESEVEVQLVVDRIENARR